MLLDVNIKCRVATIICVVLIGAASAFAGKPETQIQAVVDATGEPPSAPRGMGPTPDSQFPHHSNAFPVRLDLRVPSGRLEQNDTSLFDFVLTNVGSHSITLPISLDGRSKHTRTMTLYITSPDGRLRGFLPPCAELFGQTDHPATFMRLQPGRSLVVHASSRYLIPVGHLSLVGHVEYLALSKGTSTSIGTTDSNQVERVFFPARK